MELRRVYRKFIYVSTGRRTQVTNPFRPPGFEVNKPSIYTRDIRYHR